MFLSQNHGQKALVLLKNGKCGYMSSGNHWQWLQDICSFFHTSPLTLPLLLLLLEQNSGIDLLPGPKLWSPTSPTSNLSYVHHQSSCVWCTHILDRLPLWHTMFDPASRATSPDCREPANLLLWAVMDCFSAAAAWYGCFCLPSSLLLGGRISPQEKEERNEKSSKAGEWQERISDQLFFTDYIFIWDYTNSSFHNNAIFLWQVLISFYIVV